IALSQRVFAHSETTSRAVAKEFNIPAEKISIIPHGHWVGYYQDDCSQAAARAQLGIAREAKVFLFFGGAEPYKNLPALVQAFGSARSGEDALWIVGRFKDQDYRAEVLRAAAGSPAVRIVDDYVPDEAIQVYMAAADAVVLPYREILTSGAAMLALSF